MPSNFEYERYIAILGLRKENQQKLDGNPLQYHPKIIMEKGEVCAVCRNNNSIGEEVYSLHCR